MAADDDLDLRSLDDDELVKQMHDDLYDGLKEEIEEGVRILLDRGWEPYRVLTEALARWRVDSAADETVLTAANPARRRTYLSVTDFCGTRYLNLAWTE